MKFFFDTADKNYIDNLWNKLSISVNKEHVAGITTNPNAFSKINAENVTIMYIRTYVVHTLVTILFTCCFGFACSFVFSSSHRRRH